MHFDHPEAIEIVPVRVGVPGSKQVYMTGLELCHFLKMHMLTCWQSYPACVSTSASSIYKTNMNQESAVGDCRH